ncbi:MAG: hypothetical protein CVT66_01310 [Actinobacteria bacterium HGW-Actinobacteria-6]|nr:MAG: hypothetical protein CVT66_01310 [Actinobacteria bacterium HGW-Actinobacteria-6]
MRLVGDPRWYGRFGFAAFADPEHEGVLYECVLGSPFADEKPSGWIRAVKRLTVPSGEHSKGVRHACCKRCVLRVNVKGVRMRSRLLVLVVSVLVALSVTGCAQSAEESADGRQVIEVSSQGTFEPAVAAKAGQPIRLEFGPGGGCTAAVKFDQFGIYEDLTDGGGTVELPALDPGQYSLICQSDMVMGVLVVE